MFKSFYNWPANWTITKKKREEEKELRKESTDRTDQD